MRPRSVPYPYSFASPPLSPRSTSPFLPKPRPRVSSATWTTPHRRRSILLTTLAIGIGFIVANVIFHIDLTRHESITNSHLHQYISNKISAGYHTTEPETQSETSAIGKPVLVALVIFQSRSRTELLDCYLQSNLAQNGGLLDRVIFIPDTDDYDDLDWLKRNVAEREGFNLLANAYSEIDGVYEGLEEKLIPLYEPATLHGPIGKSWRLAESLSKAMNQSGETTDPLWLFIGAEIIYLSPDMLESMVNTHETRPEYSVIQANVVNQQTLSWIHDKLGTTKPYRPEGKGLPPKPSGGLLDHDIGATDEHASAKEADPAAYPWRASELPMWSSGQSGSLSSSPKFTSVPSLFGVPVDFQPPPGRHRWLPFDSRLYPNSSDKDSYDFTTRSSLTVPITSAGLASSRLGNWPWTLFAQRLYSFLEHLEEQENTMQKHLNTSRKGLLAETSGTHGLSRYKFPLWSFETEPISLSLFLVAASDIYDATPAPAPFPYKADELELGQWITKTQVKDTKLRGRGAVVDGHAIAARFTPVHGSASLGNQTEDAVQQLEKTDLLDRFRAYSKAVGGRKLSG